MNGAIENILGFFRKKRLENIELYLLAIGLLFRLLLSPFTKDPLDMDTWISIGSAIYSGQNPYALPSNALVYPPLWSIVCTTSYVSYTLTRNSFLQYFTIKLPIILADILICLTIRKIVHNLTGDTSKARRAMILYLFNPVTIIISSLWGMFDAIPALFALLSILYLSQNKYLKSSLTLGIGIGFKGFFPALLLPIFLLCVWKKKRELSSCVHYLIYSILIPLMISTPFFIIDPHSFISSVFLHANRLPQNLTYWFLVRTLLEMNGASAATIIALSSFLSISSFLILYLLLIKKATIWPTNGNPTNMGFILEGSILTLFSFFVTSNVVNEQYLLWVLPLLIIYMIGFNQPRRLFFYVLCGLNILFVAVNIGPSFFAPIIEMPPWWTNFQYSGSSKTLMILTGSLFSTVSGTVFLKLIEVASLESQRKSHLLT